MKINEEKLRKIIRTEIYNVLNETIRVDTRKYQNEWGQKPRGQGMWFFKIGKDKEVNFNGNYGEALKKAKEVASDQNITFITVLP